MNEIDNEIQFHYSLKVWVLRILEPSLEVLIKVPAYDETATYYTKKNKYTPNLIKLLEWSLEHNLHSFSKLNVVSYNTEEMKSYESNQRSIYTKSRKSRYTFV